MKIVRESNRFKSIIQYFDSWLILMCQNGESRHYAYYVIAILADRYYSKLKLKLNKTPAEQRDIFRPKLFYNYINLKLKKSQCSIKTQRSSHKRKF